MTSPAALIDELEFRSYVHNRKTFPDVEPERWALIFSNVLAMEEHYLDMLSTGNILDVAPNAPQTSEVNYEGRNAVVVGVKPGAGCGVKSPAENNSDTNPIRKNSITYRGVAVSPAAPQVLDVADQGKANSLRIGSLCVGDEGGGEILSSSPLYLLASEIVDIVEFSEQLRLEEEAAAEEGAAIEASGYPDPQFESNGRY